MKFAKTTSARKALTVTTLCGGMLTGLALPLVMLSSLGPTVASAQDYTSGAVSGRVTDASGKPVNGATLVLTSRARRLALTLTSSASGRFSGTGLEPGDYDVTVRAPGYDDYKTGLTIVISEEARLSVPLTATGSQPTVVVKGRARQDFTRTTTGLTVDVDTLAARQPIARTLSGVTLLAPGVVAGNPGFTVGSDDYAVASFGGGSVAENAYYIDGLNITNPDNYVGAVNVPFDFYKTIEVKTGGYQAEFGRATGGVVNATTKSGTNTFTMAVHGNYQPMQLQNDQLNTYASRGAYAKTQNNSLSVELGGPIIRDHLFAYGLYQANDTESRNAAYRTGVYAIVKNTSPFMGAKIDGFITPTQHISLTWFDTTVENRSQYYSFTDLSKALNPVGDTQTIGGLTSGQDNTLGGKSWVLNYSGKVTDAFSVSAAYGDMKGRNDVIPADTASYYVQSYYSPSCVDATVTTGYCGVLATTSTNQPSPTISADSVERRFWRLDGDVRFEAAGRHHVRFGYDREDNSMHHVSTLTGTVPVNYQFAPDPDSADDDNPDELLLVTYQVFGGKVSASNSAAYIQDSWDITEALNVQVGVRDDAFAQNNLSGQRYLDLKGNVAPRLGFAWLPGGQGDWKIFGSYGANFIPPAMNMGYRGKDMYFQEYFHAPAGGWVTDPTTGLPASVGAAAVLAADDGFTSPCPASNLSSAPGLSSVVAGQNVCYVAGNGTQEGANSKTALGLKATEEDEFILGTSWKANDLWTFGVTYTNRTLKRVSEDSDFQKAIISYLQANGLDASQYTTGAIATSFYIWNVGDHDVTIRLKDPLPNETGQRVITLTAAQLGHFPDAKRDYSALTFDFRRAFDGKWGLQGSYTWSRSYGNYEGTVRSDVGNAVQADAGGTLDYDMPSFETYATGLLSNDRTHQFKMWGSYAVTPDVTVGTNIQVISPAHFSCYGLNPVDAAAFAVGPYSHYCNGQPAPEGKGLKSDWTRTVDLSLRYAVPQHYALGGKLILRADIFNLFDTHSILTRRVTYETTGIGKLNTAYGYPTNYNKPRYVRLGFDLSY
ncbi:TonB-dependent receptor [Asticcacaulis solisilvae]|uniref:TonB-dependent receptor n=1 Tax=Asticcacaulis solisilvae TaxID=1217274 RepID=UPI003FD795BE